jgi:adenylate kinase
LSNVIFICGIHGSGKTTLGQQLSAKIHNPFDSASKIIKEMTEQNWDNEKRVNDINKNQNILLEGINKKYSDKEVLILDGHFTLLNKEKQITNLSIETFRNLNLSCIILCVTSVDKIIERIKERDGNTSMDFDTLGTFQEAEQKHANIISIQLGIPIFYYDTNKQEIDDLVKILIKEGIL